MKNKILLFLRFTTALIFLQTLFFKFTASPESVYIFSKLGMEPFGRIASGILEFIAAILLSYQELQFSERFFSFGIILGAIFSHLTILGIIVQDDNGLLFFSIGYILFSSTILFLQKRRISQIINTN